MARVELFYQRGVEIQNELTWTPTDRTVDKANADATAWANNVDAWLAKNLGATARDRFEDRTVQAPSASFKSDYLHKPGESMKYLLTWDRLGQHLINLKTILGSSPGDHS